MIKESLFQTRVFTSKATKIRMFKNEKMSSDTLTAHFPLACHVLFEWPFWRYEF